VRVRRRALTGTAGLALVGALAVGPAIRADLLSKRYRFQDAVILEIGAATTDGLRLDTVQFRLPRRQGSTHARTAGLPRALVAVSNTGAEARRTGLALALFDDEGRLLAVARGGNRLAPIKPERQKTFVLEFDGVNTEVHRTAEFQISLESKP
jgi:hypothetical protein